jgi:hypothetical protein
MSLASFEMRFFYVDQAALDYWAPSYPHDSTSRIVRAIGKCIFANKQNQS